VAFLRIFTKVSLDINERLTLNPSNPGKSTVTVLLGASIDFSDKLAFIVEIILYCINESSEKEGW
jgi:hypothetical protein